MITIDYKQFNKQTNVCCQRYRQSSVAHGYPANFLYGRYQQRNISQSYVIIVYCMLPKNTRELYNTKETSEHDKCFLIFDNVVNPN